MTTIILNVVRTTGMVPDLRLGTLFVHCSDKLMDVTAFTSVQSCIHFSHLSCIDEGSVGLQRKVFSSAWKRFTMGLSSELCGGQSMCGNNVSCSLRHSSTN